MAGQDNYNHPSYLVRQQIPLTNVVAGAAGTSGHRSFPSSMRLRAWQATTVVVGTATTSGQVAAILQAVGTNILQISATAVTTSTGTVNLGTAGFTAASGLLTGAIATVADQNAVLPAGTVVSVKNGVDAVGVTGVTLEMYLDPSATWTTGSGN